MARMRVTLRVFKVVGAKRRLIATSARVMQQPRINRVRFNSAVLRRRLVPGRYAVEVTPSAGAGQAGTTASSAFQVIG